MPVSLATQRSPLLEAIRDFNARVDGKPDPALARAAEEEAHPFAAVLHQITSKPEADPVGVEQLRNGIALTLLLRRKLNQNGYFDSIDDYAPLNQTPDQILYALADKLGVAPHQVREAARTGGIDAVGALLAIPTAEIAEIKSVTEAMAARDFSDQYLQHWTIGRRLNPGGPIEQKVAAGLQARIDADVPRFQKEVREGRYDVAPGIRAEEERVAGMLDLLEPIQRKIMFALGYEICYTPERLADGIAFFQGIRGLNRKAANRLSDVRGTYRIYVAGGEGLEQMQRTLVHEAAHVMARS